MRSASIANQTLVASLVEAALDAPYGIKVRCAQGSDRLRQAFYAWRAQLPIPLAKNISTLVDPEEPEHVLWFVHTYPSEHTPVNPTTEEPTNG